MKINRRDLHEALDIAEMSLAPGSMIPIMRHFWFTGTHIVTYDDRTSVSLPFASQFKGAVPAVLLDIVKNSRAREIEIGEPADGHLPIKMGRTKASFPFMPDSSFVFDMPKFDPEALSGEQDKKAEAAERALIKALEDCLCCINEQSPIPDHMGVTLDPSGTLYATNSQIMCAVQVAMDNLKTKMPNKAIILSAPFCRQLVKLGSDYRFHIKFTKDSVIAKTGQKREGDGDTDIMLFGRLLQSTKPLAFADIAASAAPNFNDRLYDLLTDKYVPLVQRANVIAANPRAPAKTHVTISDGVALFETTSTERGVVRDEIKIEGQADAKMIIDPVWLRKIGGDVSEIRFYKKALQLRRGKSNFLIASTSA